MGTKEGLANMTVRTSGALFFFSFFRFFFFKSGLDKKPRMRKKETNFFKCRSLGDPSS